MPRLTILYWQNIPSLLEARDGKTIQKRQLSSRFQELIDMVAMRKNLSGSEAYLEHWRKGAAEEKSGDIEAILNEAEAELEGRFEEIRSSAIADLKSG